MFYQLSSNQSQAFFPVRYAAYWSYTLNDYRYRCFGARFFYAVEALVLRRMSQDRILDCVRRCDARYRFGPYSYVSCFCRRGILAHPRRKEHFHSYCSWDASAVLLSGEAACSYRRWRERRSDSHASRPKADNV
jgi:hypothetical protein